ncbi:MAG TPA: enoyl-CoA hydratase-related protein, partial [Candidatus Binatia bacterium]|nr:enoyl-CoA hydratase-related protein [Candidatus Binatia bacterium]
GLRRALELVFLNPRIDARRALEIGLVTDVHPIEQLNAQARTLASRLAAGPTSAYGVAKRLLNLAAGGDQLDAHLDQELESLARIADGVDFGEGLESFLAKREPRFGGR